MRAKLLFYSVYQYISSFLWQKNTGCQPVILERKTGFEPATPTLARLCSTPELLPQIYFILSGGGARNRSGDTRIFSPLLYQLSYPAFDFSKWRSWRDSNSRPSAWQADALTDWATAPQISCHGGRNRFRTYDPLRVRQVLSRWAIRPLALPYA